MDEYKNSMYQIIRDTVNKDYSDDEVELYLHLAEQGVDRESIKEMVKRIKKGKGLWKNSVAKNSLKSRWLPFFFIQTYTIDNWL